MKKLALTAFVFLVSTIETFAEISENKNSSEQEKSYFVKSKGYSSNPESDPPQYVVQLDQAGINAFKNVDWIDLGLNYRVRFEHRDNDFRKSVDRVDNPILSRTQAYFGIKNIIDPLRFAVELQDSRRHNSEFPRATGDVNKLDVFQAYGELYFKNPIILDRPLSLRVGRMAFEIIDRKLFSRDDWGNAGTNFQGFRAIVGKKENDWQFDSFAFQPMVKKLDEADHKNKDRWLYAAVLNWRRWSEIVTLQPFYFKLDQKESAVSQKIRINSPGFRLFGTFGKSGFDYDLISIYQFGEAAGQTHRAYAYATELGYRFERNWRPRFSLTYGYSSGDKNPNDAKNQRFERLYGFNRPWSNSNTIEWENLETLKSRIEFQPHKKLHMEGSYSFYWLASATDSWARANLQDKTGNSGEFIGQDLDFRAHYKTTKHSKITLGFAHFRPGKFTKNVGRNNSSDFVYLELTLNPFK